MEVARAAEEVARAEAMDATEGATWTAVAPAAKVATRAVAKLPACLVVVASRVIEPVAEGRAPTCSAA